MKIGILTFHSQLNYGGVLQCWALKMALEGMGHEVVVVDRWLDEKNGMLRREFVWLGWKGWVKLLIRGLLGCGDFGRLLRTIRTIRFVKDLGLSKGHFWQWETVAASRRGRTLRPVIAGESLDFLVVGSDQVWHCGDWGDPRPYLLEGAPEIQAISYAASFGLKSLPSEMVGLYKRGLARFSAISCREQEGVEICRNLGFAATHVVDPTLLVAPSEWRNLVDRRACEQSDQSKQLNNVKLVCYFMSIDLDAVLPLLENFATQMNCSAQVVMDASHLKPMPRSIGAVVRNFRRSRVKICRGYGPKEFVRAFSGARWVLTDSFHAVMFSSVFNCNARFVRPANEMRKVMFARIEEFAEKCIKGDFFVDDVKQALQSFECGETIVFEGNRIGALRAESLVWLKGAIHA